MAFLVRRSSLQYFLAQHGVDVCLQNETRLDPGQAFRFANYVCHRTDRSTKVGEQLLWSAGFRALCSTFPGSEAPGGNCYPVKVGWYTN
jgi:hypothetical protein